ncbi:MAG: Rieske 2Fe-2S domain-containing protein [Dehalococcoidia bacterium]
MTDETIPASTPIAAPDPARSLVVDTPVAKPLPRREVITRRVFLLGGFWSAMSLAIVGFLGGPLDFMWPRGAGGFGGPIPVTPDRIPAEGGDPLRIVEGRFWLLNIPAGPTRAGADSPGGLLALYQKCPHLGCTVPYSAGFTFDQQKGWFRCPCHGSTYSRDGGVKVAGPAPRPMDVFPLAVNDDLSITVSTGRQFEFTGTPDNPSRAAKYEPGSATPELEKA